MVDTTKTYVILIMKLKRYSKEVLLTYCKSYKEPLQMNNEPHEIIYSAEENLRQVLQNYKTLNKSIDAFINAWAEDENIRNRPERQKLCTELCEITPHAIKFSDVLHKIEKATGLEVLK